MKKEIQKKRQKHLQRGLAAGLSILIVGGQIINTLPAQVSASEKKPVIHITDKQQEEGKGKAQKQAKSIQKTANDSIDVKNYDELKRALKNPGFKVINLTDNIDFPSVASSSDIEIISSVEIKGNGYRLRMFDNQFNYVPVAQIESQITFDNVRISGSNPLGMIIGFYNATEKNGATVTLNDVTYTGAAVLNAYYTNGYYSPYLSVVLSGKTNINVKQGTQYNPFYYIKDFTVKNDSDVKIDSNINSINAVGRMKIEKNATLNVNSANKTAGLYLPGYGSGQGDLLIEENATLNVRADNNYMNRLVLKENSNAKFHSYDLVNDTSTTLTADQIIAEPESTLEVKSSKSAASALFTANGPYSTFEKMNLDINNLNPNGHAIASGNINFINQNVNAWINNGAESEKEAYSWKNVEALFTVTNSTSTITTTDNKNFERVFQTSNYNRISSNGAVTLDLTVDPVSDRDTSITGKTTAGATIKAIIDGKSITGTVNKGGSYTIPTGKIEAGKTAEIVASLNGKNMSKKVTVADKTAPEAPTVETVTEKDTVVKGKGEKGATVIVKLADGSEKTGKIDSDGNFSVTIPTQKANAKIEVSLKDAAGNISEKTIVTVKSTIVLEAPTVSEVKEGATTITGKATPNAKIVVTFDDDTEVTAKVKADGTFSVRVAPLQAGEKIKVHQTMDGATSQATTITVAVDPGFTPETYTVGDSTISGKYTGDITRMNLVINGNYASTGGSFTNGKFSYYISPGQIKASDKVELVAYDKNKNEVARKMVSIKSTTKGTITPDKYAIGEQTIKGKYTGDTAFMNLVVNGKSISWGGVFENGKFTYYVKTGLIKLSDKVELIAYDDNRQELDRKTVSLQAEAKTSFAPDSYKVGDSNITGTYTGTISRMNLVINGAFASSGGEFKNGKFSYFIKAGQIKATDKVELIAYDANRNEAERKAVNIIATEQASITPNEYTIGESNLTGKYSGNVALMNLIINGKSVSWGGSFDKGTFSYYTKAGQIKAGDKVELVAYDAANKELDRKTVSIKAAAATSFQVADFTIGTTSITGTYKGDIAQMNLIINGKSASWGGSFVKGTFSYYTKAGQIKAGDKVELVAYDAKSKQLAKQTVTIKTK